MKRTLLLCTLALSTPLFAIDVDPKLDKLVREALPVCGEATISYQELPFKLLPRFTGALVRIESERPSCEGQYSAVLSPAGRFYLGMPWPIESEEGATAEEKLKNFTWRNMNMNVSPVIDRTKTNEDGLHSATLFQLTESGKLPLEGEVDPNGRMFFFGHFLSAKSDLRAQRMKAFESFLGKSPARGAEKAAVTIVEFSDFECPSCKRSSGFGDMLLAKHGEEAVRYIRFDLPLSGHPWAFSAALAGRAIHRQKPDVFWEFKKQVYENQENLNAFMFWDWARGFAEDRELDMKKFDADVNSEELKNEILAGAGIAFSNDVRATPTYLINGVFVDAGAEGKGLDEYVAKLLAK
ncbi:MAG TPA: thioredoxin domain-containing protein [Thermoanaerobaculia bacterium]|nr:thioredoxin domain-containing protein [Thermoanaerobaculia bacterium]